MIIATFHTNVSKDSSRKWRHFYIWKVKGHFQWDIIMFCKSTLTIFQSHNLGAEGKIVSQNVTVKHCVHIWCSCSYWGSITPGSSCVNGIVTYSPVWTGCADKSLAITCSLCDSFCTLTENPHIKYTYQVEIRRKTGCFHSFYLMKIGVTNIWKHIKEGDISASSDRTFIEHLWVLS